MDYKKTLKFLSENIFDLKQGDYSKLSEFISDKTLKNISIYQRNLFGGVLKNLSRDFPALFIYLGENNFQYLVREFILGRQITSPNISEASRDFSYFLSEAFPIHQDQLVEYLGKLDAFWSLEEEEGSEIELPIGVVTFWSETLYAEGDAEVNINLDRFERVRIHYIDDEKALIRVEGPNNAG